MRGRGTVATAPPANRQSQSPRLVFQKAEKPHLLLISFLFEKDLILLHFRTCVTKVTTSRLQDETFSMPQIVILHQLINNLLLTKLFIIMGNKKENKNVLFENVTIKDVTNLWEPTQIDLLLDVKVPKINPETNEETQNDQISIKLKALQNMLAPLTPLIGRLARRSMGKRVNPVIFADVLQNAVVTIEGRYFTPEDTREDSTEKYSCFGYRYVITDIVLHMDKYALQDYEEDREKNPYYEQQTEKKQTKVADWILEAMKQ